VAAFHRHRAGAPTVDLGDEDPLYTRNISKGPPDRRRVSIRWFAGSLLTGIFSACLVGGSLQAAIGLDEELILRPAMARSLGNMNATARKGDRFRAAPESETTRQVIQVSTVTRNGDRDIVRVRPFAHVRASLVAPASDEVIASVPDFSPIDIYSDGKDPDPEPVANESIYVAEVDGEISIKVIDFPLDAQDFDVAAEMAAEEIEESVREAAPFLADGAVELASLPYVDPGRFEIASTDASAAIASLAIAIAQENVSAIEKSEDGLADLDITEKVISVAEGASMKNILLAEGAKPEEAIAIQSALVANFSFDFRAGQKIRLGLAEGEDGALRPVRVTLYEETAHLATVALSDTGAFVAAAEPALDDELFASSAAPKMTGKMPSLYAGLWRTALTLDMDKSIINALVRIFAYDVDFQTRAAPGDGLEVVYAADGNSDTPEILFAALRAGSVSHRFYRFRSPEDGSVDYYDEAGKSAQKFLMRKPLGQGRFSSSFGMRRHPILGRYKLHSGVDWAAPRGTPIMAAGNGVVQKIGTRSGYGKSITLSHANGYETTYNHMTGYAKGVDKGDRVRQGQVIGYVGSTGLSTGSHLHFEVLVNDRFVDPMKIRLPRGRELQGAELAAFVAERERVEALLHEEENQRFADASRR
jgi:murein DD-endopeptidase MepM/ murein hydrolase activator NlpD